MLRTTALTAAALVIFTLNVQAEDLLESDPVEEFLSQSAFVGNSVGEGLTMYNDHKKKEPLGNATMLTRVSYSFYADRTAAARFLPVFAGTPMQAKKAIQQCGARYAFICMGTNDLVGSPGASSAYEQYLDYLAGIREINPEVTIFIESCTPTRPGSNVNNEKVTEFNAMMRTYCDTAENTYYVDIATPLTDESGYLASSFSSDGSVHLTNTAYAVWADSIRAFIASFLAAEKEAIAAQNELERQKAHENYVANMKEMEAKKSSARAERITAERKAEEAERAKKHYRLLNVPDEVSIMKEAVAKVKQDRSGPGSILQHQEAGLISSLGE
ncbi:MAG: hypothetical protein K6E49_09160 [Lachnospiraceae bacterium]|nr:hypothetical protein [Lachnospiraceae bacterium]